MEIKIKTNKDFSGSLFKERRFVMLETKNKLSGKEASVEAENKRNAILFVSNLELARQGAGFQSSFNMEPNPYKDAFLKFFKEKSIADQKTAITGVQNIDGGLRVSFADTDGTKTFDIKDDAYRALIWGEIVERAKKKYKGKTFNMRVFSDAITKEGSDSSKFAGKIGNAINVENLQKDYMGKRLQAAREFEAAVKKAHKDIYEIYNNENIRKMGNEELAKRIRACLRLNLDKNSPVLKYLESYDVIVELPLKDRKKDKKSKPAIIYLKSTKTGSSVGMKITLTKDNITVDNGGLEADLPEIGSGGADMSDLLEERKTKTVEMLQEDMQKSWDLFMKDGHPESNWPEVYGLSGHKKNLAAEYAKFLKKMVDEDKNVQRGLGLLKSADLKDFHLRFNKDYTDHFLSVSYVRQGNTPGIQIRWYKNGKLVDETRDVYPISSKTVDQMDVSVGIDPKDVEKSFVEHDKLYAGKESAYASSQFERNKLKQEMLKQKANVAQSAESVSAYSSDLNFKNLKPNFNVWELDTYSSIGGVNPDTWDITTDEGRSIVRKDFVMIGLPAQIGGDDVFENMFNQFRKCTDTKYLEKLTPEQRTWYKSPEKNYHNLASFDPDFYEAHKFCFEQVKGRINMSIAMEQNVADKTAGAGKSLIDKAIDIPSKFLGENWDKLKTAINKKDLKTIGVFVLIGFAAYKLFWGKNSDENPILGKWKDQLKKAFLWGSVLTGAAYLAKNAGWDISSKIPGLTSSLKGTPYEPLANVIPEAFDDGSPEKLDGNVLARASTINMGRLYEEYQNSNDKKGIDPKIFTSEFPEFEGKSRRDLEKNANYKHIAHQLYLVAHYVRMAYERTYLANKTLADGKSNPFYGKSFKEILGESPYNTSDVLRMVMAIMPYGMTGEKGEYKVDIATGKIKKEINEEAAKYLRDVKRYIINLDERINSEKDKAKKAWLEAEKEKYEGYKKQMDMYIYPEATVDISGLKVKWDKFKNFFDKFHIKL